MFTKPGEVYAIYLPKAQPSGRLDLTAATGEFSAQWYDPRTGEFAGPERTLAGGGVRQLAAPPADPDDDWALLVKRSN